VCGWKMNNVPLRKGHGILDHWKNEMLPIRRELHKEFPVRGMNVAMENAFTKACVLAELEEVAGCRRYATLDLLVTDPKYQRQGAASTLLKGFVDQLESAGRPCYVVASTMGKQLYMKHGFEPSKKIDFDAREWYGGNRRCVHWVMVQHPWRGGKTVKRIMPSPSPSPRRGDNTARRLRSHHLRGT